MSEQRAASDSPENQERQTQEAVEESRAGTRAEAATTTRTRQQAAVVDLSQHALEGRDLDRLMIEKLLRSRRLGWCEFGAHDS